MVVTNVLLRVPKQARKRVPGRHPVQVGGRPAPHPERLPKHLDLKYPLEPAPGRILAPALAQTGRGVARLVDLDRYYANINLCQGNKFDCCTPLRVVKAAVSACFLIPNAAFF